MLDQALAVLREFGFPTFVALWFMLRLERRIDRLAELLTSLMQASAVLARAVEDRGGRSIRSTEEQPRLVQGEKP